MTLYYNMPTPDADPPCCAECDGSGEVENPHFGKPSYRSEKMMLTCPKCSGLGVPTTRVKERQE